MTVETVTAALGGAFVYSIVFYMKEHENPDPEDFDLKKMGATLIVGVGVAVGFIVTGRDLTFMAFEEQMAAYAGTIAVVESILKTIYKRLKKEGFI